MTIRYHLEVHAKAGRLPELKAELARLDEDTRLAMAAGRRYLPGMMTVVHDSNAEIKAKQRREWALRVAIEADQPDAAVLLAQHPDMDLRCLFGLWQGMTSDKRSHQVHWATFDALVIVLAKAPPPPALRALLPQILDLPGLPGQHSTLWAHATPALIQSHNRIPLASELMARGHLAWATTVLDSLDIGTLSKGYGLLMDATRRTPAAATLTPGIIGRLDWAYIRQQQPEQATLNAELQTALTQYPLENTWGPALLAQLSEPDQIRQVTRLAQDERALAALDRAHAVVSPAVRRAWLASCGPDRLPQTDGWQRSEERLSQLTARPTPGARAGRLRRRS